MTTIATFTLSLILFLTPIVAASISRSTVALLLLLFLALVLASGRFTRSLRHLSHPPLEAQTFAIVSIYLAINSLWAEEVGIALSKVAAVVIAGIVACISSGVFADMPADRLRQHALSFTVGWVFALVGLLTVLVLFNTVGRFGLEDLVHKLTGISTVIDSQGYLDRNTALVAMFLFPALLAIHSLVGRPFRTAGEIILIAVTAVMTFLSDHESSRVAVLAGTAILLLAKFWLPLARQALIATWCLCFVLFIPLSVLAYKNDLHRADWLPLSARARIILWNYTVEQIPKAPVFGVGVRSTRFIHLKKKPDIEKPEGHVYPLATGRHAHSLFVQSWYELGLVGVLLIAGLGVALLRRIGRLPEITQPYALASFTAFMSIAAFAWGMFQTWLLASYALIFILLCLGIFANTPPEKRKSKS